MAKPTRASQRARKSSFTRVGTYHGVEEYVLRTNGLRVLYRHDDTSPVVGLMVTYLVGSRHEAVGHTGATHLLEHLMFKGSKKFPNTKGVSALDRLGEKGALVNATTWLDRTNYYEVLPKEHIEFAVQLEADRMRNARITAGDLTDEMPAVRSEYARGENDPLEALDKHVWATAYLAHPYHHSTIGWLSDIEHVSAERLKEFYDTYYWPDNATVTLVGDISRRDALGLISKYFGVHRRAPHAIPEPYTTEPPQRGRRFVEVIRNGSKHMVGVAYKVPEALHADTPALLVLSTILGGGDTSRLHRALVEKGLASDVRSVYVPFKDPSLITFYASPVSGVSHDDVEEAIRSTIATLTRRGVTKHELEKVLAGLETDMALARDGHYAMLSTINEAIASGSWKFYFDLPRACARVTAEAVQRAARTYLTETVMTVGYYRATPHHE